MESKKNFFSELRNLNSEIGISETIASKYDYENLNLDKKSRKSFRIAIRKSVESIYLSANIPDLQTLKKFSEIQENSLLACTKAKKKFTEISVSDVYPSYNKCNEDEKKKLIERHKKIVSILSEKKQSEKKQSEKKQSEKIEKVEKELK